MFAAWEGTDAQQSNFDAHPRTACMAYSVEKLLFQAAKNNLSLLGKFYFEGYRGKPHFV
jgi:hypothetical protein